MNILFDSDTTVKSFPSTKGMHPSTCAQRGIFGLGNPHADETALRWVLQQSLTDSSAEGNASTAGGGVVVFGSGTDALAAIGGLIKNNVPSAKISLVIPEIELEELGHNTVINRTHTLCFILYTTKFILSDTAHIFPSYIALHALCRSTNLCTWLCTNAE